MKNVPSSLRTLAIPLVLGSSMDCSLLKSIPFYRERSEQALRGTSACSGKNKALNKLVAQKKLREKNPNDTRPILFTIDGDCVYAYFDESVAPAAPVVPQVETPAPTLEETPKPPAESTDPTPQPRAKGKRSGKR
jgi:hypothetical protein